MKTLNPNQVRYIVWHTAAHAVQGECRDTTLSEIDSWHRDRGFEMIGYHYLIRRNGAIVEGRPLNFEGAHVLGLNDRSIGICFSGHGDVCSLTDEQMASGVRLSAQLLTRFGLSDDFIEPKGLGLGVMGHREVNRLVATGQAKVPTDKSCPGKRVDMDRVRAAVRSELRPEIAWEHAGEMHRAVRKLYELAHLLKLPATALRHLNAFRNSPEVENAILMAKGAQPR